MKRVAFPAALVHVALSRGVFYLVLFLFGICLGLPASALDDWAKPGDKTKQEIPAALVWGHAATFCEGLAAVTMETGTTALKYQFIDQSGKPVFDLSKTGVPATEGFSEGFLAVRLFRRSAAQGCVAYVDKTGKTAIEPQPMWAGARSFSQGLAAVGLADKDHPNAPAIWGFIDKTGTMMVPATYTEVTNFSENVSAIRHGASTGTTWSYIDKTGKVVLEGQWSDAEPFSEGLAAVKHNGKWSYIDHKGKLAVTTLFDIANPFSDGMALVKVGIKWYYIDKDGNQVVDLGEGSFGAGLAFSEGLARVGLKDMGNGRLGVAPRSDTNNSQGFIDKKGSLVINFLRPGITDALGFSQGFAPAQHGLKWGYVDKNGAFFVQPQFDFAGPFKDGLAVVQIGGKWGFVGLTGDLLPPP